MRDCIASPEAEQDAKKSNHGVSAFRSLARVKQISVVTKRLKILVADLACLKAAQVVSASSGPRARRLQPPMIGMQASCRPRNGVQTGRRDVTKIESFVRYEIL